MDWRGSLNISHSFKTYGTNPLLNLASFRSSSNRLRRKRHVPLALCHAAPTIRAGLQVFWGSRSTPFPVSHLGFSPHLEPCRLHYYHPPVFTADGKDTSTAGGPGEKGRLGGAPVFQNLGCYSRPLQVLTTKGRAGGGLGTIC